MEDVYAGSLARTSFTLVLLAIAGGMALVLGVIAIYNVNDAPPAVGAATEESSRPSAASSPPKRRCQNADAPSAAGQTPSRREVPDEKVMNCRLQQFTNGVTRVSAILRIDVKATNDDWGELTRLLHGFAESHGWSFRDQSETQPGVVKTLYLTLCAPNRPRIEVGEQRWASRDWANPIAGRGIMIGFYGDVAETAWHPVAIEIVALLETHWRVRFLDGGGYEMDRPEFLGEPASPARQ
jgi:hypothetical protein